MRVKREKGLLLQWSRTVRYVVPTCQVENEGYGKRAEKRRNTAEAIPLCADWMADTPQIANTIKEEFSILQQFC